MKKILLAVISIATTLSYAQSIEYSLEQTNGALNSIKVENDKRDINWILHAGLRRFIKTEDLWGLGKFTQTDIYGFSKSFQWNKLKKLKQTKEAINLIE